VAERAPLMSRPVAAALLGVARAVTGRPGERLLARSPISGILAITQFHQMVLEILRSPVIWIAAVNGPCAGGGLELSVYFDVRLAAAETATFQLPELSVGLTTTVGAQRLTHLLGPAQALELLLEARAFSADQARDLGLISRVVPAEILVKEAQALASRYAARPRRAVAAQKQIINQAYHVSARKSLIAEALAQVTGVPTPTTRAALREWVGRQRSDGASVFETDPEPWVEGTAVPMNPPRNAD
jgi:enoyl-CoA hydratase